MVCYVPCKAVHSEPVGQHKAAGGSVLLASLRLMDLTDVVVCQYIASYTDSSNQDLASAFSCHNFRRIHAFRHGAASWLQMMIH